MTDQDPEPAGARLGVDLLHQRALAHPGLPGHEHERAAPDPRVLDRPTQVGPLLLAADERGLGRSDRAAGVVPSQSASYSRQRSGNPRSQ